MKRNDINTKLEFYLKKNQMVHVKCGSNRFYNGKIIDLNLNKEFLILKDKKLGEIPILFEEIERIEPYKGVGE